MKRVRIELPKGWLEQYIIVENWRRPFYLWNRVNAWIVYQQLPHFEPVFIVDRRFYEQYVAPHSAMLTLRHLI